MSSIGIFAGTFDPIHDGHIAVAKHAQQYLGLASVAFLVEQKPWGAKQPASVEHRRNMVQLVVENLSVLELLHIDDERFTITDTLPRLEKMFSNDELFFIMGADVFLHMNFESWPNLASLLTHNIVVFERGEATERDITRHAKKLGIAVAILPSEHIYHRSTDVRLAPHDKNIWVPQQIAEYIDTNNLY